MPRIFLNVFFLVLIFGFAAFGFAQQPAADKTKDPKAADATKKVAAPKPFWRQKFPEVVGKLEAKYDLERDGVMQPHNTKIFLRDVRDEVNEKNFFNIQDSGLLKTYDKNKDGVISKLELQDILKDLKDDE